MMIEEHFNQATEAEYDQLKDAVAQITVLIADADGQIDSEETEWAEKIAKIRSYALPEDLNGFYKDVGIDFHERLEYFIDHYKGEHADIMKAISDDLAKLNTTLAKLDQRLAAMLYSSYKSFAKHVAKSSGGFLGFFSIGPEEAKWLDLPMITPIDMPEEA